MKNKKLLLLGNMRWGKDTMAEILNNLYGYTFQSSSQAAADIFIFDELKDKYGYETPEECFEDRVNHRAEWYNLICDYNKDDRARLAKGILEKSDCYVGMRDRDEIEECMRQGLFDLIVWVDASKRLPEEDKSSFNIDKSCADVIVDNNGTLVEFVDNVIKFAVEHLGYYKYKAEEIDNTSRSFLINDEMLITVRKTVSMYDEYIVFYEDAHRSIREPEYLTKNEILLNYGIKL